MWSRFKTLDLWLLVIPLALASIGIAVIYSITVTSQGGVLAVHQGIFLALGLLFYLLFTFLDYRSIKAWAGVVYIISIIMLALVKVVGTASFGARRWVDIGFFQLQPSEIAKIAVIALVARLLADRIGRLHTRELVISLLLILLPTVLVLNEPDLGSAMTVFAVGAGVILSAGLSRRQWVAFAGVVVAVVLLAGGAWFRVAPLGGLLKDYQRARVETFLNPAADASGSGYNVLQATIAIGSGGVFGKGLGYGSQSQLNFLPVAHTDFLFASLAESWGFLGTGAVILLYLLLLNRIVRAARTAPDGFGQLLCLGIAVLFFFQLTVNAGMNLSLLPVTGITLPLMSAGGTSLLTAMALLGMVQSVVIREQRIRFT